MIFIFPPLLIMVFSSYLFRISKLLTGINKESIFLANSLLKNKKHTSVKWLILIYMSVPVYLIFFTIAISISSNEFYGEDKSATISCEQNDSGYCYQLIYSYPGVLKDYYVMKSGEKRTVSYLTKYAKICSSSVPTSSTQCKSTLIFPESLK